MKRSTLHGFGMALILSGIMYTGLDYFSGTEVSTDKYEEKIEQLELQLKEAKRQLKQYENQASTKDETSEHRNTADSSGKKQVKEGILYIYSGQTPYEIAKKLKDMGIIQNAVEMELFLAQPEYARSIQIGQYEVNSSMSVDEIANLITGKSDSSN